MFYLEDKNYTLFNTPSTSFFTWYKPSGFKYLHIIACGGGGGGGSGASGGEENAGGGGGGGSGVHFSTIIEAWRCPDVLYILIGAGGNGGNAATGANGASGTAGGDTSISLRPVSDNQNNLVRCPGGGGGGGGTTGAGAAGTAGSPNTLALSNFAGILLPGRPGLASATNITASGDPGTAGAGNRSNAPNNDHAASSGRFILGGTGGGGLGRNDENSYTGGAHTTTVPGWFNILGGQSTGVTTGGLPGRDGFLGLRNFGFFVSGGTGGASTGGNPGAGLTGGTGGKGILGSGGGGGGASPTARASGAGGRGGDGFVLIKPL
jgi:hypothetical protein